METTFEKLNDNEMINVVGGDRIARIVDSYGNVFYIIIEEDEAESEDTQP
jgi:bacteriocin-like protein